MNSKTNKIVIAALFAALACVATIVIKVPYSATGYFNLGDCIVLLSGWMLSPVYALLASGLGSALADIILGSAVYAPATFVIKALMALTACYMFRLLNVKFGNTFSRIVSGAIAELIMVTGYFLFEGALLYGFAASALYVPANAIQAGVGMVVGVILAKLFEKNKILK